MSVSIKSVNVRCAQLDAEKKKLREELAVAMSDLIPGSLQLFVFQKGWLKKPDEWRMPLFLDEVVTKTQAGKYHSEIYHLVVFPSFGFTTFKNFQIKMNELAVAWAGVVRIEIIKERATRVEVRYFAVEYEIATDCEAVV